MKSKKIVSVIALSSLLFTQTSQAILPAIVVPPLVAGFEIMAANAGGIAFVGTAAAVASLNYEKFGSTVQAVTDGISNLVGKTINAITINGASKNEAVVNLSPNSVPSSTPANWNFDFGKNMSYDPSVNSAFTADSSQLTYNAAAQESLKGLLDQCPKIYYWLGGVSAGVFQNASNGTYVITCTYQGGWVAPTMTFSGSPYEASFPPASVTAPPMWPSDGHCDYVRNGNTFSGNPQDPDCWLGGNPAIDAAGTPTGTPKPFNGLVQSPNGVSINNGNGSINIVVNPDGSLTVTSRSPSASGQQTVEDVITVAPPVSGQIGQIVSGQSRNIYNGTGSSVSPTPISQTISPPLGATTGATSGTTSGTNSGSSNPPLQIPTDYARQGTLDAVKGNTDSIKTSMDSVKTDATAIKKDMEKLADSTVPAIPGLPPIPTFYTRAYPNGLKDVWQKHSQALTNTPLVQVLGKFVPSWGNGSCPKFQVEMNFASWANFGTNDLSIPCTVWDVVGVLVMLSALFTSRRIIFGG